jgi:general secretion pathway protein K
VVVQGSAKPMALTHLDDLLAVPGFTLDTVARLRQYAIVLPARSAVNVNTAAPEVIAAVIENYSVSEANALVVRRKQAPFINIGNFNAMLGGRNPVSGAAGVRSDYFLVLSRVRLDRAALDAEALVWRMPAGGPSGTVLQWVRQN